MFFSPSTVISDLNHSVLTQLLIQKMHFLSLGKTKLTEHNMWFIHNSGDKNKWRQK